MSGVYSRTIATLLLTHMPIELTSEARDEAIASLQTYSEQNFDERLGNLGAASLLDFVLEEIGPSIYNQALKDLQERLQAYVMEVDVDLHQEEFAYWVRRGNKARGTR